MDKQIDDVTVWLFCQRARVESSMDEDDKVKRLLHARLDNVNGLCFSTNLMMRSTQQHQTEFNKSTNLFICSRCTLPRKALTLCKHIYTKIHCKNINTSHLIDLSGAQSESTTRCCLDPTHHLCRIPPSLHRAISMLHICVWW